MNGYKRMYFYFSRQYVLVFRKVHKELHKWKTVLSSLLRVKNGSISHYCKPFRTHKTEEIEGISV